MVLADEPTGNLDAHSARVLMDLLKELNERKRVTMLIVTHNERVADYCHRRLYLDDGLLRRMPDDLMQSAAREGPGSHA